MATTRNVLSTQSLLLLVALFTTITLVAQQQTSSQSQIIVGQALSSMGASVPLPGSVQSSQGLPIQDSLATGTISFSDGRTGTLKVETKGLDRLRHETVISGNRLVAVFNAGEGFTVKNGARGTLPLWATKYLRAAHIPALSRMADYVQPNAKLAYVGLENTSGKSVHHIRLSSSPTDATPARLEDLISEFHVFIDAQSLAVIKTKSFWFSPETIQNRTEVETFYSDYRLVDGLSVPFHMTQYSGGQQYCDVVFTSIAFNTGIPADADFE